jgi:superfamily II DNA or RNA helicase
LRLAEILQTPTLIITPRKHLVAQYVTEIEKLYGFTPASDLDGRATPIMVCTLQGIQRRIARRTLDPRTKEQFGLLIVDECHLAVPPKSRAVVQWFNAKYRYGLSATPERGNGQSEAVKFLFGEILVDKEIPQEKPQVVLTPFYGNIPSGEYPYIIRNQTTNKERNALIVAAALQEIQMGRRVLILTKRIGHYEILLDDIRKSSEGGSDLLCALRSGETGKDYAEKLSSLRDGTRAFSCILGTFSLIGTGIDIPSLDTLIIAGDLRSSILTKQSAGRVLRLFQGKKSPKIIDIQDQGNPILKNQAKDREKFYRANGWDILNDVKNKPLTNTLW